MINDMEKLVYNIDELACALGFKSVGAVYKHVHRQNWDAIPPPVRLGSRLVWPCDKVKTWLNAKTDAGIEKATTPQPVVTLLPPPIKKKRGRPRKTI